MSNFAIVAGVSFGLVAVFTPNATNELSDRASVPIHQLKASETRFEESPTLPEVASYRSALRALPGPTKLSAPLPVSGGLTCSTGGQTGNTTCSTPPGSQCSAQGNSYGCSALNIDGGLCSTSGSGQCSVIGGNDSHCSSANGSGMNCSSQGGGTCSVFGGGSSDDNSCSTFSADATCSAIDGGSCSVNAGSTGNNCTAIWEGDCSVQVGAGGGECSTLNPSGPPCPPNSSGICYATADC